MGIFQQGLGGCHSAKDASEVLSWSNIGRVSFCKDGWVSFSKIRWVSFCKFGWLSLSQGRFRGATPEQGRENELASPTRRSHVAKGTTSSQHRSTASMLRMKCGGPCLLKPPSPLPAYTPPSPLTMTPLPLDYNRPT